MANKDVYKRANLNKSREQEKAPYPCHRSDAPAMCWMHTCTGGTQPVAIARCHIETERRQNSLIMCNIY